MKYNSDQVVRGIEKYAENEVISKLPTIGKWFLGAGLGMAHDKISEIALFIQDNSVVKTLGIVDENGMVDIDRLMQHMKKSAETYGKAYIEIPMIGKVSFDSTDVDVLKDYIVRS